MTFIGYPNIVARSRNGDFRFDIIGHPARDIFRDQSGFVYRLFRSNRLVWEWTATSGESQDCAHGLDDCPHEAWVSDDGWSVVRTHAGFFAGLMAFSPRGEVVLRRLHRRFLDSDKPGFLEAEPSEYMGDSSAGPFWARSSMAYFTHHSGQPIWVIRTWWGCRVAIDLSRGQFFDPTVLDTELLHALESSWICETLEQGIDKLEELSDRPEGEDERRDWSFAIPCMAGAYQAGWVNVVAAVPILRRMETLGPALHNLGYGYVRWAALITVPFRQVAKLSLLRLGQEPKWVPHYGFAPADNTVDDVSRWIPPAQERNAKLMRIALDQQELVRIVGAPDFIGNDSWEYDFFSPTETDESDLVDPRHEKGEIEESSPRIAKIEIVESPWKQITKRDHDVIC